MKSISLLYAHGSHIGYGRLGVEIARELGKRGVTVYDDLPDGSGREKPPIGSEFDGRTSGASRTACWISTPSHAEGWWEGQTPSIVTMWEATNLPEAMREGLHNFERVIVPSQQNVELFSQYHDDVSLMPLGIDPELWRFTPRTMPTTSFRFLIGGSGPRKGGDLARKAFRLAFPRDHVEQGPMPVLVLKSPKGDDVFGGPGYEVVSGRLSAEDEVALYESAHCYLQPSRGEGFGLQPLQAIAQGCPTILTGAHGHAGYAHLGMQLDSTLVPAAYFIYGDAGQWWEPDLDQLVELMRWTYENYETACQQAAHASQEATTQWTWSRTVDRFLDILGEDNLHDVPMDAWHAASHKRFRVVLNRDWTADMGGSLHLFLRGKEYWETADVKRIMFEAGYLDPSCLDEQGPNGLGLTEEQVAKIPDYTAAASFCPTCGQKANSGVTRSDEIFAELEAAAKA